ncbi:hypothetical protein SPHINGO8AM_160249 [Sphingomonas sp. 8AM]|nr:hypothetical protein SPHINGO8AM_160249 [Sphingomonas sp. 8AM]
MQLQDRPHRLDAVARRGEAQGGGEVGPEGISPRADARRDAADGARAGGARADRVILLPETNLFRHCERSEAMQGRIRTPWIASLRSQ